MMTAKARCQTFMKYGDPQHPYWSPQLLVPFDSSSLPRCNEPLWFLLMMTAKARCQTFLKYGHSRHPCHIDSCTVRFFKPVTLQRAFVVSINDGRKGPLSDVYEIRQSLSPVQVAVIMSCYSLHQ
jgi:hypothetical protein